VTCGIYYHKSVKIIPKSSTLALTMPLIQFIRFYCKPTAIIAVLCSIIISPGMAQKKPAPAWSNKLKQIKNDDSAAVYARYIIDSGRKKNDELITAKVILAEAYRFYNKGDELQALDFGQQACKAATVKDKGTYIKAFMMVAYMMGRHNQEKEALKIAFGLLKQCETNNWKKESVDVRICIADLYSGIDQAALAVPYSEQAAKDAFASRDSALYISALSNLSNVYSHRKMDSPANVARATRYMEIILNPPYAHFNSDFTRARYLANLGRLYVKLKQTAKAEQVLKESLEISTKNNFPGLSRPALNELTTLMNHIGRYNDAIKYAEQNLALLPMDQSSVKQQYDIYSRITDAYEGLKNYQKAFEYAQKSRDLNDSITALDKAEAATELDKKYKADKHLLIANNETRLVTIQRNFIIIISLIVLLVLLGLYRFFIYKRKKQAAQLAERNQQLAKLDAIKSRFFANISHELRTPLTLMLGPLDQLINTPDLNQSQQQRILQTVLRNSKKLHSMVNELLDLGKIEAGNLPVHPQVTPLLNFFTVLYQGFASAAEYKQVAYTLTCTIDSQAVANIDREKLEKVFNNLIANAIKFTPEGKSVTVNIGLKNNQLEFMVTDTGPGIHPDDLPRIFDRYYQGTYELSTAQGGSGVGLAIAREFTELLGGTIAAESKLGEGSIFKITLPVTIIAAVADELIVTEQPTVPTISIPLTTSLAGLNATILLVEDHAEMAGYVSGILHPHYQVLTARNGIEALELLHNLDELPQLIISDVMMPGMDGFTLLEKLKEHPAYYRIPVIMLTALADSRNKLKALQTGVDDYLTKPFIANELLARAANLIGNALERTRMAEQDLRELLQATHTDTENTIDDEPTEAITSSPADMRWLSEVEVLVRKYTGHKDLNIAILSYDMAISERQLFRRIKAITGLTPNKYIRNIRLQIAREAIESGKHRTVAEVSYAAGFDTPAYFSKLFKEHYGRDVNDLL
jgi:signal transduction histidine kinase/DNA-binding response OmpR family regulator